MLVTVLAWAAYVAPLLFEEFFGGRAIGFASLLEMGSYVLVITTLGFSAMMYLTTRHGGLVRSRGHRRTPRGLIDDAMRERGERTLTMLVPSYREEPRVIRQTLLSAALQEYPHKRVVLLIDDPPVADSAENAERLTAARRIPHEIAEMLSEPAAQFERALARFERSGKSDPEAVLDCAGQYRLAIAYVETIIESLEIDDHTDEFLRDEVIGGLARELEDAERALRQAGDGGEGLPADLLHLLYRRLLWTFRCELESFERKQFVNSSHEPNKAMNLNSYIELIGGCYELEERANGVKALVPCDQAFADLVVPPTDYILTLDADSVLLPEYCLRLVHRMELPSFSDVAVIQTPYSSFPGARTRLERIAAATTDLQHTLHQGMTYFEATFWVGANAILRFEALDDIVEIDDSGPWPVKRYISDHTVIEDTESSVDLVRNGWRLHNYNERLSYSATPPDFGSLCIQRQRWANGGLLILPKLLRSVRRGADPIGLLIRMNYVASIAWSSFGLLLLLLAPYDDRFLSPLVLLMAAPYFLAMASDLRRNGYKRTDIVRVYAFNLVMLPVNLAGTIKSLYQGVTGRKFAFARTPKVANRTTAGFWFVLFPYLLIGWSGWTVYQDLQNDAYAHAAFAGTNALLTAYALLAYIGVRWSLVDMAVRSLDLLKTDRGHAKQDVEAPEWEEVLYYGAGGSGDRQPQRVPARLARAIPENVVSLEERTHGQPLVDVHVEDETPETAVIDLVDHRRPVASAAADDDRAELLAAIETARALLDAMEQRVDAVGSGVRSAAGAVK